MIKGFIPPSSPTKAFRFAPASVDNTLPTSVEPVKLIVPISSVSIRLLIKSRSRVRKKLTKWSKWSSFITCSNFDAVFIPNSGGLTMAPDPAPKQLASFRVMPAKGSLNGVINKKSGSKDVSLVSACLTDVFSVSDQVCSYLPPIKFDKGGFFFRKCDSFFDDLAWGMRKSYFTSKNYFLVPPNQITNVNKAYIHISNWQKLEL